MLESDVICKVACGGVEPKFVSWGTTVKIIKSGNVKNYALLNEVLCYELGLLFGVKVCKTERIDKNRVYSEFAYGLNTYFVTAKQLFGSETFDKYFTIAELYRRYGDGCVKDFQRMLLFDLIIRQEDRHISNFAFCSEGLYPLYDNGRCLFWNSVDISNILCDVVNTFVKNEHGYGYAYIDMLGEEYCDSLLNKVGYNSIFELFCKYYDGERARILSQYVYKVYKLVTGGVIDA